MTEERQAGIIAAACKHHGLDRHIKWIKRKRDAHTDAERIAVQNKKRVALPVKNSYMYCDTLDMCFYFVGDIPHLAYAGYVSTKSKDLTKGKLATAFMLAEGVLKTMERMAKEENSMKHGKRPTVRQKKLLKSLRRNPDNWLVVTEDNNSITIIHRETNRVMTLNKR